MAWKEISVSVTKSDTAQIEAMLADAGALAVTLTDSADQPILEPGVNETPLWPEVCVTGLFAATEPIDHLPLALARLASVRRPEHICQREVAEQDWTRAWLDRFQPICFGRTLWIYPSHIQAGESAEKTILRLDPGLAFGTGTHPTTAMCLEWIDAQSFDGKTVVDYGCGSGVLGIATALKGAQQVIAVDNDPQALEATRNNAAANQVKAIIQTVPPEDFSCTGADVVLANILSGPLIALSADITGCLRPTGDWVLSGILAEQTRAILQAYQVYGKVIQQQHQDGWMLFHGQRSD